MTLDGFTPDTLICSEEVASNGGQEWVKASSVFEFDEVPVNESPTQPAPQQPVMPTPQQPSSNDTKALLAQLTALTSGIDKLQAKLDSVQHNLENALEQNKKLSDQVAQLAQPGTAPIPVTPVSDEPHSNTITLTRHDMSSLKPGETSQETPSFPAQAAPEEEEIIIRSALDSIYGGKPVKPEDTFQDLIPQKTAGQEESTQSIESNLKLTPVQEKGKQDTQPFQEIVSSAANSSNEEEAEPLPAEALDEIEKELTFMSLEDKKGQEEPQPAQENAPSAEVEVKEAVITTPDLEETAKDALIAELTASPKEDILDQIIAEHQEQKTDSEEKIHTAQIALGAAAAGAAAASLVSLVDKAQADTPAPMTIAPDKENPEKLEEVLPADQMPEDVPAAAAPVEQPTAQADLPSIEQTAEVEPQPVAQETPAPEIPLADMPDELPQLNETEQPAPEIPVATTSQEELSAPAVQEPAAEADLPGLDDSIESIEEPAPVADVSPEPLQEEAVEELVPGAQEEEGFYLKEEETPAQEVQTPAQEEQTPAQEEQTLSQEEETQVPGTITDKDLTDAFGGDDTETVMQSPSVSISNNQEPLPEGNPNELTEIQLKEGSTYLISDFVPPAEFAGNENENEDIKGQDNKSTTDKKQDPSFQDMLAAVTKHQSTVSLDTNGLPEDLAATQINLENTIQAKRGASLDIKTVPMVPEPGQTDRLNVDELNDVNAQHGLKTSGGLAKSTKTVIMTLVGLLLLIILYVALGMMKLLPASINLFKEKQTVSSQTVQEEFLPQTQEATPAQEIPQGPTPAEQAQEKVQNFPLPNGMTLKAFIESKHATISPELITWETTDAVEADNYSVTVKVPPENPQNFKTVYRFNYNMVSGLLDPTVSDAKNLLDQAYGVQPADA